MEAIMSKAVTKRNITAILKKISKEISFVKTASEVEDLIKKLLPDVESCIVEYVAGEYTMSFRMPGEYTGKVTLADLKKTEDDFKKLLSQECIELYITKERNYFEISFYVVFRYMNTWGEELTTSFNIKTETVDIDLSVRKDEMTLLLEDINALSCGTLATLIANENIGEASSLYSVIDEVEKRFVNYTIETAKSSLKIPTDLRDAWFNFKSNNDLKSIIYELGIDKSKVEPYYNLELSCAKKIKELKIKMSSLLEITDDEKQISSYSDDLLKNLTIVYAYDTVLHHCKKYNKTAVNKVLNQTLPKIENDEYDREFYLEHGIKGFEILKEY